jgi:hypothetical protein
MAFSGVAEAVQADQGLTYFAGAWVECLSYDLFWHALYDFSITSASIPTVRCTCKEQAASSVPSWSYLGLSHYTSQHFSNYIGFPGHCREQNQQAYNATPAQFQRLDSLQKNRERTVFCNYIGLETPLNIAATYTQP